MLYLSKTIFLYRFYKILVIEPTTEVNAESIGAPSVKEIALNYEMSGSICSDLIITWLFNIVVFCITAEFDFSFNWHPDKSSHKSWYILVYTDM
jgi:hypothetical protein